MCTLSQNGYGDTQSSASIMVLIGEHWTPSPSQLQFMLLRTMGVKLATELAANAFIFVDHAGGCWQLPES